MLYRGTFWFGVDILMEYILISVVSLIFVENTLQGVSKKEWYTFQSVIFSSILEIQQNQIYHWIRNYVVYLHV